jgi:quercetin dioxygenase-like cupin family protein
MRGDTNGAYYLMEAVLKPGNEPPPHVHSREDELFYVLEGSIIAFAGENDFSVGDGACVFLPRLKPHAFIIRSPLLRMLALFTPVGIEQGFRGISAPAEHMELPENAVTHSDVDPKEITERMSSRGVRLLSPEEVASQMPSCQRTKVRVSR